jgi:tetratricopeptide (TPR) repeat protein
LDQGQFQEAVNPLTKACQLDPELASAFYALSQAKSRLGDQAGAKAATEAFQKLKQKEKTTLDEQNATYDNEKAMRILAAGFHTDVAAFFLQRQDESLAETNLLRAIKIAFEEPRAYEALASLRMKNGKWEAARGVCEELVRRWPKQAAYRVNLGTILLRLKDYPAAISELKRALDLDPNQVEALNNLVRFHLGARQNPVEALGWCRRLVLLQPTAANYDLLGWALYANGQVQEARQASAEAVRKDPQNPVYQERKRRLDSLP